MTKYAYYAGDGTVLRDSDPDFHRLEIYRGDRQWAPYPTRESFFTGHDRISDGEARQLIDIMDGNQPEKPPQQPAAPPEDSGVEE